MIISVILTSLLFFLSIMLIGLVFASSAACYMNTSETLKSQATYVILKKQLLYAQLSKDGKDIYIIPTYEDTLNMDWISKTVCHHFCLYKYIIKTKNFNYLRVRRWSKHCRLIDKTYKKLQQEKNQKTQPSYSKIKI